MDFKGKVVIITGGSSGIGLALAKEFAARDAHVFLAARRSATLEEALASIPVNPNGSKYAVCCDVCVPAQVDAMIQEVIQKAGPPDILVNCAGVVHPGFVQDLDLDKFKWMMETNYFGVVNTVKAVLPGMIQRGSGMIVNVGSLTCMYGVIGYSAYSGSKFAMRGFTESLRMELKSHGIQVSLVMPPDTDTPQLEYENQYKPLELKYLLPDLGVVPPEQVAREVMRGIQRGQFEIVPDLSFRVGLSALRLSGTFAYTFLDWLLLRARARIARQKQAGGYMLDKKT
jgi:3-dehydrosphinganine reductase